MPDQSLSGGNTVVTSSLMTTLAGVCATGLCVYLFYALVKPERF
ncbi:K(+)-transporting ATPase subunit F [Rhizobium sp. P32RR-XVIII]